MKSNLTFVLKRYNPSGLWRMGIRSTMIVACVLAFGISAFGQQLINVEVISSNNGGPIPVFAGQGVLGGPSDTTWNALNDNVTSLSALLDSTGAPTSVGMTCSDPGSWNDAVGNMASFCNLLSDYRFTGNGSIAVTLTGLNPNSTYALVAYGTGNDSGQGGNFYGALTGATTPTTRGSFVLNNNYVENPVVAPDSTGTSFYVSNSVIQCFNGLQIQQIPPNLHAPVITSQPVSQLVRQGQAAGLSVAVDSGSQIPHFQWYLGSGAVAGATNSALTFASISAGQGGNYKVVITNLSGSVTSSVAALTIDTTTTTSIFTGGNPGQGLDLQGANFTVAEYYAPQDNGSLTIQNATFTNNINRFTSAIVPASGNVAPDFGSDLNDTNLSLIANNYVESDSTYDPLTFSISTASGQAYKLQLIFHDAYNSSGGRQQLSIAIGSELVEPALDVAGQGGGGSNPQGVVIDYYFTGNGSALPVTISNILDTGFATLNALTLQPLPNSPQLPYFVLSPQNQTAVLGGNATFSAVAGGSVPPISYQWFFGANAIAGATNTVLNVANIQNASGGQYYVVASNSAGSVTNSATLTVNNNVSVVLSSGPAPGQGMNLQGNFVLAEYYNGGTGPNLPISGTVFVSSTRAGNNGFNDNLPNFGFNSDDENLAQISYQSVSGNPLSFSIDTTAGISYRLQLILHEGYFTTPGSRVFSVEAISDGGSGATTVLAPSLDLAALGAYTTQPTNVVVVYYFTGDGNPVNIQLSATANAACISGLTLEDLTDVVAPTMAVPLQPLTVYAGSSVQYIAHVNGTAPLAYQWAEERGDIFVNLPGATNYILNLTNVGNADFTNYQIIAANAVGAVTNVGALQNVVGPDSVIIGHWLSGTQSFADTSGYTPAGTHDGVVTGTNYYWTNDVPPNKVGFSLYFGADNTNTVVIITNTWNTPDDPGYLPTFDDNITNACSFALWAKGFPGTWSPWLSKRGDDNIGYQLRRHGGDNASCFTIRGTSAANSGDLEATANSNDGKWHYYVGTYDSKQGLQSVYVDGVLSAQTAATGPVTTAPYSRLIIGAQNDGGGDTSSGPGGIQSIFSNGEIYDVRIYNYSLGPLEVAQLAAIVTGPPTLSLSNGSGGAGSGLVLTWSRGNLLEATNVLGPWTTNANTSPYTIIPTGPQKFFRVSAQ